MHGVFMLDPREWRMLFHLHSDGLNKTLPPGVGKVTERRGVEKGYIEPHIVGYGRLATSYWRRTAKGDEAIMHDVKLNRLEPLPWSAGRK